MMMPAENAVQILGRFAALALRWVRISLGSVDFLGSAFGLFCSLVLSVTPAFATRDYSKHEGYIESTAGERETQYSDVVMVTPPAGDGPNLHDRIFNDKLSREFRERYEEKFGRTEVERVYNSPNRFTFYDDVYGMRGTPQEITDRRRDFGEFMMRRLAEYHVENWAKNDPKVRPMWEAKERLSELKIQVKEFRLDVKYSLAGNTLDMLMVNPYLTTARVRMELSGFGTNETIITLGRNVTPTIALETDLKVTDGVVQYILRKSLTPSLSGTLSASTFTRESGSSIRESVYLSGLGYVF
jgi:hypothetical protein